jgi:hypothetical protein
VATLKTHISLPQDEVTVATQENSVAIHRAVQRGSLRKLGPKLYTRNLNDDPERIIQRNCWQIAAAFFPGALIADRTALENRPAPDGSVFLVAERTTALKLPGLALWPRKGSGPITGSDRSFIAGLWMSSNARALLENMRPSRARDHVRRTLAPEELELWLERILRTGGGETVLNRLRDQARELAPKLGMEPEAERLSSLIGALLGTRSAELRSDVARARSHGQGFDPERTELFEVLRQALATRVFQERYGRTGSEYLPFFEAYFSNFIEGTEFLIDEAYAIVFEGLIPAERPEDAHDILGTFKIVSDPGEMGRPIETADDFIGTLLHWHAVVLEGRANKNPGQFKLKSNRAGDSLFVEPDLVEGTLRRGFELLNSLEAPMARAIFMLFLVSEVHPFVDGNGRIARIMMNAELVKGGQERIIIPTVYRSEYIQALKALTHNRRPDPLVSVLDFAQAYVSEINWSDYHQASEILVQTHAFEDPADALGVSEKLRLPSTIARGLRI